MELVVDFWDVGQGDCSVIRLPDKRLLIIDTGPPDSPLVEWLAGRGEQIYGLVLTHNDEDHAGCLTDLLERFSNRLRKVFLLLDRDPKTIAAQRILGCASRYAERGDIKLFCLQTQETGISPIFGCEAGSAKLVIYGTHPDFGAVVKNQIKKVPQPNSVSAVICLDIDGVTQIVWAGDAPMNVVADKCEGKKFDVIIGPHHGGPIDRRLADHSRQYDRFSPENVFVSAGTGNGHGHPVKAFIDEHRVRGRRVVCSQMVHCDNRRVEHRRHVMRQHLELGLIPPQNSGAVTCRGPMRLTWNPLRGRFEHDEFHEEHRKRIGEVHRPYCLGGLLAKK